MFKPRSRSSQWHRGTRRFLAAPCHTEMCVHDKAGVPVPWKNLRTQTLSARFSYLAIDSLHLEVKVQLARPSETSLAQPHADHRHGSGAPHDHRNTSSGCAPNHIPREGLCTALVRLFVLPQRNVHGSCRRPAVDVGRPARHVHAPPVACPTRGAQRGGMHMYSQRMKDWR